MNSPITEMQADELMRYLDRDGSGTVDYSEFCNGFRLNYPGSEALPAPPAVVTSRFGAGDGGFRVKRGSVKSAAGVV
jgi:hypothetical protein